MTDIEMMALQNDLNELKGTFNPQYVSIYKLPCKPGCSFCLKVAMSVPTYISKKAQNGPIFANYIEFFVDILPGYPKTKPRIYYGNEAWLYHVNVFASDSHAQCTDVWDPLNSSICEIVEKTARAVVFDSNRRYNSMANSVPEAWQKRMESEHKLPTMNPALLFKRNMSRAPSAV